MLNICICDALLGLTALADLGDCRDVSSSNFHISIFM